MVAAPSEPSWLETYYTALEFFYWEPQHLGRIKDPRTQLDSIAKVAARLRGLEVTLNHNLDQFFRLAPSALRNRLFETAFRETLSSPFTMHGHNANQEFRLQNFTQPDFLFESAAEVVSVEMKIKAKCSIDQVLKYALLGLAVEHERKAQRNHFLLLLGKGRFADLWHGKFEHVESLKAALENAATEVILSKAPEHLRNSKGDFHRIVAGLRVAWMTYADLIKFINSTLPAEDDSSPFAEVYRKLVGAVAEEIVATRKLASEA